jgi:16S rRNA (adenine1518-N6/adenine1519-N6)-dimethyltransferase
MEPKKSLGQHWLKDEATLEAICEAGDLGKGDTVLEIGPGLGDLTRLLVKRAGKVIAIELDEKLAADLSNQVKADNLEVVQGDILKFDLAHLPLDYKVVANIPYYLTSNLIRILSESSNSPALMALLIQKEVAQRLAAQPGQMSLLGISAQLYYIPKLGPLVSAELFLPPPKVDSQLIILKRRQKPLFENLDTKLYFRLVKAGFAGRRKKLRGSLSAGLGISKDQADKLLQSAGLNGDLRAQNLSLQDWHKLYNAVKSTNI